MTSRKQTKQTKQKPEPAVKPKEEPQDPGQTLKGKLEKAAKGGVHFDREWLEERSNEDLIYLIADLALELKERKAEATERIATSISEITFADTQPKDVKIYTRLPKQSHKSAEQLAATTWRIILTSGSEGHTPLGLDIVDNVMAGRSVQGGTPADLDLTPYDADNLGVSRQHALLRPSTRELLLIDLGSTNGTLVNGEELKMGKPHKVEDGDTLTFGGLHFKLKIVRKPPVVKADKA